MSEGIVSARALARRCDTDFACRWALGGETVSHHTLSDFLRQDCGTLDALLSQTVSALHRSGAVSFDTLLVDGTKVKARAGADSFGNAEALEEMALRRLSRIRKGRGETASERAARERAERECVERRAEAVKMVRKRQEDLRAQQGPATAERCAGKVKASLSDAEARRARRVRLRVERVIGSLKRRGMRRIPVFGLLGAARWARWQALAHNLMLLQGVRG